MRSPQSCLHCASGHFKHHQPRPGAEIAAVYPLRVKKRHLARPQHYRTTLLLQAPVPRQLPA